jgi:hypothetical protein
VKVQISILLDKITGEIVDRTGFDPADLEVELVYSNEEGIARLRIFLPEGSKFKIPENIQFWVDPTDPHFCIISFQMETLVDEPTPPTPSQDPQSP